jgi:hypothetical protein
MYTPTAPLLYYCLERVPKIKRLAKYLSKPHLAYFNFIDFVAVFPLTVSSASQMPKKCQTVVRCMFIKKLCFR